MFWFVAAIIVSSVLIVVLANRSANEIEAPEDPKYESVYERHLDRAARAAQARDECVPVRMTLNGPVCGHITLSQGAMQEIVRLAGDGAALELWPAAYGVSEGHVTMLSFALCLDGKAESLGLDHSVES